MASHACYIGGMSETIKYYLRRRPFHALCLRAMVAGAALAAAPAGAEMLHTMPHGTYECGLPGDAGAQAWNILDDRSFRIARASSYRAQGSRGTYLLVDDLLTFTSGPLNGQKYRRTDTNILEPLDQADGASITCVRKLGA